MTVKELIIKLQEMNPESIVSIQTHSSDEDGDYLLEAELLEVNSYCDGQFTKIEEKET